MRLPDFLIIGGMKCGTTSLFFDLGSHPAVFLPADKEPRCLAGDEVLSDEGRRAYARLFRGAREDQLCGEASTAYSKLPDVTGVPSRARRLLPSARILYLVREPVARTISHHRHLLVQGGVDRDLDRALRREPSLIHYSRYAMQIRPWIEAFGRRRVRIVRFERYVRQRRATVAEVCRFLGLEQRTERIRVDRVYNRAGERRVPGGAAWRLSRHPLYRSWIRPWLSRRARAALRGLTMPAPPPPPPPPSRATVDAILERLREDAAELQEIVGASRPLWDFAEVRRRYRAPEV